MAYLLNATQAVTYGSPQADAYGRGRVSEPQTLFNVSFEYDLQPLLMNIKTVGTGSVTKATSASAAILSTGGTASGSGVDFQSKGYYRYEPGKSLLVSHSGLLGNYIQFVRSAIGYFDVNNGLFFDLNGTSQGATGYLGVTLRTNTSGSPVDTTVLQPNWNIDTFNGSGPSGLTLNLLDTQLFIIDFEWQGAGRVRFGFNIGGTIYYGHQILNANQTSAVPYMNTACLPVHVSIYNTGTAASTSSVEHSGTAVISEGGNEYPTTQQFSANTNAGGSLVSSTRTPILSIQPRTTFGGITNRALMVPSFLNIVSDGSQRVLWEWIYNGTLTGSVFTPVNTVESLVAFDSTASAISLVSNSLILASGYIPENNDGGNVEDVTAVTLLTKVPFTLDFTGTIPDTLSLCVTTVPKNTSVTVTGTLISTLWNAVALDLKGASPVSYIGGATAAASTNVTTLTTTYAPTAGHTVIVVVNTSAAVTALVVKDSHGNTLTAGPVSATLAMFYQASAVASTTGFVATWTTGAQAGMTVVEYSGVASINTPTPSTATATSTTASITSTMLTASDFLVVGLGDIASDVITGTVGNTRQQIVATTKAPITFMDATVATGNSFCSGAISWTELR